ncbi:MAG: hypothetical protein JO115_13165 [Pseudonocardiales bacterium]|nr:hypothetical protein [Pseudonocardiales bacterium]
MAVILSEGGGDGGVGVDGEASACGVVRSRRLHDRFSSEDLQVMIGLYGSWITVRPVAEKFGVSLRCVKRLLYQHGVS